MIKNKIFLITTLLISVASNAQITKGNWMVGGTGSFTSSESKTTEVNSQISKSNTFNVSPNIGYFIIDKLSVGTLLEYETSNSKWQEATYKSKSANVGPFVRYYFLKPEKPLNLFLETSYNFSLLKENNSTVFSSKLGAVYFLNSSVGLELMLRYTINNNNYDTFNSTSKGLTFGLGLQIHLEKSRN